MNLKISVIALFFLFIASFINAQPVKEHGQLKVEGTRLVDKNGKLVILRGMSFGWHNWWPRFYNAGTVKWPRMNGLISRASTVTYKLTTMNL